MSNQESLLDSLFALKEDTFTKEILQPIFKALGYTYVSFNGGPYEFGVDLVAAKKDELLGKYELTVIQSKKLKAKSCTKEKDVVRGLLTQLNQCKFRELEIPEAGRKKPDKIILATPGQLSSRLRDEVQQVANGLEVNILEGPQIIKLINSHCPHLIKYLNGIEGVMTDNAWVEAGNTALKKALFINKTQTLTDYACDLQFYFGSRKENSLRLSNLDSLRKDLIMTETKFEEFKVFNDSIEERLGFSLTENDLSTYYEYYLRNQELYHSTDNQNLIKKLRILEQELDEILDNVTNAINDAYYAQRFNSHEKEKALTILNRPDLSNMEKLWESEIDDALKYSSSANLPRKPSLLIPQKFKEIESLTKKVVHKPEIRVSISKEVFDNKILEPSSKYLETLESINSGNFDDFKVRQLLRQAKEAGLIQKVLFDNKGPFSKIVSTKPLVEREGAISIPSSVVIDTSENLAIFGGAGFGKTTLLQLYASKCEEMQSKKCILVELAENVNILKKHLKKEFSNEELADGLLKAVLEYKGINDSVESLDILKRFLGNGAPLMLDGLDEVYSEAPEIIKSIKAFTTVFSNFQIVVTSRPNMSYLDEIELIGISLLPFTQEQLFKFIRSWCSDQKIADKLINKVESSNSLKTTLTNPLLATIVCHLAENGINIPRTESKIYEERVKLLTGTYDQAKGIKRQKNLPENLMLVAEKLAFVFHVRSTRKLTLREALKGLRQELSSYINIETIRSCLTELIEPCDVLQLNTSTNELTFGHFRYQESLVAQHLKKLNHHQFIEYLARDLWKGAFELYAEQNDINAFFDIFARVEGLFDQAYSSTLETMIIHNTNDYEKRQGMKQLLKMVSMEEEIIGVDYDFDSIC